MLFADFFSELLGGSCCMAFFVLFCIGSAISSLAKNEGVKEAARIGFWAWFLSDDD